MLRDNLLVSKEIIVLSGKQLYLYEIGPGLAFG